MTNLQSQQSLHGERSPRYLLIAGATASGKTALSLQLAQAHGLSIISADSRQCYRYLDIGTDKVSEHVLQRIPHYHISLFNPDEINSAARFADQVTQWATMAGAPQKPVLVVGGSTLYLQALLRPLSELPAANASNLKHLQERARIEGPQSLLNELRRIDPVYADRVDGWNPHRIFRALDVYMQTGKPFSSFHRNQPLVPPEHIAVVCVERERAELHKRIEQRVDHMLSQGLVEETRNVLEMGYDPGLPSLQTVGYRQCIDYLHGKTDYANMREQIIVHTRGYARRQITWFKRWQQITRLNASELSEKRCLDELQRLLTKLAADL